MRRGSFGAQRIKTGGGAWPSASGRRRRHYFIMYVCKLTGIVCLIALSTQQAERQRTHLTPATPQDLQHSRANTDSHSSHNTQDTRVKNKIRIALCKRTLSPARHVLEDTSHQTRPKANAGDASLLMGRMNWNILD
jgi:hypothetical protein